jgi:DNA-binding IclR family transcriptional regulator
MVRAGGRQRSASGGPLDEESDSFVRALARGLGILALFDIEHPEWGLNDICSRTGMSKTTAYRMVRTLEAKEFLAYDAVTERYHLGKATIPGAYLTMSSVGFVRAAHPFLERLCEATGETVELTVRGPGGAVVVDQVASRHPFRLNLPIGRIQSTMSTSSFRTHVAFLPLDEQRKIIGSTQPALTPNTMTDPDKIIERMTAEREEGLAYDLEEQDLGVCAVSAPVLERDGSLKAVLTTVAPAERFGARERKKKAEAVRNAAGRLTDFLNGRALND